MSIYKKNFSKHLIIVGFLVIINTFIETTNANSKQSKELKLKGVPLACYVKVGAPSSGTEGPTILIAEASSTYWSEISLAYANEGKFAEAIALIAKMEHDLIPVQTKLAIITKLTENKQYARAFKLIETIKNNDNPIEKTHSWAIVASQYAKTGNSKQAERFFIKSLRYANSLAPELEELALINIIVEYANANQFDNALQLVKKLKDKDNQQRAAIGIAEAYAKIGKLDEAIALVRPLNDYYYQSQGIQTIAQYGQLQQLEQLKTIALTITDNIYKAPALGAIAIKYARLQQFVDAQNLESTLVVIASDGSEYYKLPQAYAEVSRFTEAISIAQKMPVNSWQDLAFINIVEAYTSQNKYEEALKFANSLPSQSSKNKALQAIAQGYAQLGKYQIAKEIIQQIKPIDDNEAWNVSNHYLPLIECAAQK